MASRHQFHLRWSNYGHNLANSFIKLFESESLADVTLFCEGESYRAHRVVLAASSVHFQELFEQCSTAQNLVVILDGTSAANLRALLEFMYKGEVYIDDANLNTFLQTAKRLQVKGLSLSQNDLHSISTDVVEDRGDGKTTFSSGSPQDTILAQALGPLLQNPQPPPPPPPSVQKGNNSSSVQSPPATFSSPSPSQTPPNNPTHGGPPGHFMDEKMRKKIRMSPRHQQLSPDGIIPEGIDYGGSHHQPPRPLVPMPSPSITPRHHEMDPRQGMSGYPFPPHYGVGHQHGSQGQGQSGQLQQTIVITENPNVRKLRSASTENTMPEDLSIKLEVGREEDAPALKQRSFSMDLSPSDPPFGSGLGGNMWSVPSLAPSDLNLNNAQGEGGNGVRFLSTGPPTSTSLPLPNSWKPIKLSDYNLTTTTVGVDGTTGAGKKLKCPFCERLYGYETNLRAHIRQRHQGIRVPCPFCTRTFTRNNTVRRHVAREHRALIGGVRPFHPHLSPEGGQFGSPPSTGSSPSQGSPSTSSSAGSVMGGPGMGGGGNLGPPLPVGVAGPGPTSPPMTGMNTGGPRPPSVQPQKPLD